MIHISLSSYLWFSRWSAYIINFENTLYIERSGYTQEKQDFTHWRMTVPGRQSSHHRAWSVSNAARSCRPCVCLYVSSSGADTWEKQQKTVTVCTVTNNVETSSLISYTCLNPFTTVGIKCRNPTAMRSVEITLKKQVSLASIWLCGIVMARNRKRHSYCDVTTIRQTRRFRFWRRQISRWRRRWSRQNGRGALSSVFFFYLSMYAIWVTICCHNVHA